MSCMSIKIGKQTNISWDQFSETKPLITSMLCRTYLGLSIANSRKKTKQWQLEP